jgi:NADPH-ferrihemoprotein reductase
MNFAIFGLGDTSYE